MSQRINFAAADPKAIEPLFALEAYIKQGLDERLAHLVKMRASQINGCAYCLHMHSHDALTAGESPERLFLLDAWRESKMYTERERAALAWTESLTNISSTGAPDEDYELVKVQFSEPEIVTLTLLVATINTWNRLAIGLRSQHPRDKASLAEAA
jgi:AhpD family alkylhydroperoxidase